MTKIFFFAETFDNLNVRNKIVVISVLSKAKRRIQDIIRNIIHKQYLEKQHLTFFSVEKQHRENNIQKFYSYQSIKISC